MRKKESVKIVYQKGFAKRQTEKTNPRLKKVLDTTNSLPRAKDTLLDIGCGDGSFTARLGKLLKVNKLYGIDIAKKSVSEAKKNRVSVTIMDIDERDLPYKSSHFDYVYCGNLIELIYNPDHLLSEIHRVLKKDGYAIVTFPNMCSWASRIAVFLGYLPYYFRVSTRYDLGKMGSPATKGDSTGFIRLQSLKSFKELARIYSFNIVAAYGAGEFALPRPLRLIDALLSHFPSLAFQIICILKK